MSPGLRRRLRRAARRGFRGDGDLPTVPVVLAATVLFGVGWGLYVSRRPRGAHRGAARRLDARHHARRRQRRRLAAAGARPRGRRAAGRLGRRLPPAVRRRGRASRSPPWSACGSCACADPSHPDPSEGPSRAALPAASPGLPSRCLDRRVPGRGRGGRGRQGPVHLGRRSPTGPARSATATLRSRRDRPLPPLPRGRRAPGGPRRGRLPVLDLLVAGQPTGTGAANERRPGLLRPARRRAARRRHPPGAHPLPLGPAARAAGAAAAGSNAGPAHAVRRVRRDRRGPARRPRARLDHPERDLRAHAVRARARPTTPPRSDWASVRWSPGTTSCSRTAWASRAIREAARRSASASRSSTSR